MPSLRRKKKVFHEASRAEQSVASTHRSPAVVFRGRKSRTVVAFSGQAGNVMILQ
jgi:hypothetical protein